MYVYIWVGVKWAYSTLLFHMAHYLNISLFVGCKAMTENMLLIFLNLLLINKVICLYVLLKLLNFASVLNYFSFLSLVKTLF